MPRIEIDDEVYAHLESHVKGFEQPNDVLRRLLLRSSAADASKGQKSGSVSPVPLVKLIRHGLLAPGDKLVHVQRRKGLTFTATVDENGWVQTERGGYPAPSRALAELVGSQVNGWTHWTHEESGRTLDEMRQEVAGMA